MSKKASFTTYGGASMAVPSPSKQPEVIKDQSRTYGDTPKVVSASRAEKYRVQPTQPVAQTQALGASFGDVLYELVDRVTNWSKLVQFLDYQLPAQGAGTYIHVSGKTNRLIAGVRLVGKITGSLYGEMRRKYLPYYLLIARMRHKAMIDFVNAERKDGMFPSKLPPSLNYMGFTARVGDTAAANGLAGQLAGSKVNAEPQYWLTSTAANDVFPYPAGYEHMEFSFGELEAYGVFGVNKNFALGEPCNLYIDYDTRNLGHFNTSPNNPFAGVPTALAGNMQIKNMFVEQWCETDPGAIAEALAENARGAIIPLCWGKDDLVPLLNGTQQPKMLFTPADGTFLRSVTVAAFPAAGLLNNLDDHSNYTPGTIVDGTLGGKFRSFFTELDGKQLQKYPISCVPVNPTGDNKVQYVSTDYKEQKPMLDHSLIQDLDTYRRNWSWVDSFIGAMNPLNELASDVLGGAIVAGGPAAGRLWQFTTQEIQLDAANNTPSLLWYMHAELTRYLCLRPGGSAVLPYLQQPVTAIPTLPAGQTVPSA